MLQPPESVVEFLRGTRIAVAGVSRHPAEAANAVYRKLRDSGYDVVPLNPIAAVAEGDPCYPDLASVPGPVDGVVIATPPAAALDIVRQCGERGVGRVWFHRSFGAGSVSAEAVAACQAGGIQCIVGGCPLMYVEPVDVFHGCMKWFLRMGHRVPS